MGLIKQIYKCFHPGIAEDKIPLRYNISLWKAAMKMPRKWMSAVVIPSIPFNNVRIVLYRCCGYKVGGGLL